MITWAIHEFPRCIGQSPAIVSRFGLCQAGWGCAGTPRHQHRVAGREFPNVQCCVRERTGGNAIGAGRAVTDRAELFRFTRARLGLVDMRGLADARGAPKTLAHLRNARFEIVVGNAGNGRGLHPAAATQAARAGGPARGDRGKFERFSRDRVELFPCADRLVLRSVR